MRSHFKLSLILALAMFPSQVFASTPDPTVTPTPEAAAANTPSKVAAARRLDLASLKSAFLDFKVVKENDMVLFFGMTSKECMDLYEFSAPRGREIEVNFKGGNANCLNFSKLGLTEDSETAGLSEKAGSRIVPTESGQVVLVSKSRLSDREAREDLADENGELIVVRTKADQKQDALVKKYEGDINQVATCGQDFDELGEKESALKRLKKVAGKIDSVTKDWIVDKEIETYSAYITQCQEEVKKVLPTKFNRCDEKLAMINKKYPQFRSEIRDYLQVKLSRYISAKDISPKEALKMGDRTISQIQRLSPGSDEKLGLEESKRKLLSNALARASELGSGSDEFMDVQRDFYGLMIEDDKNNCIVSGVLSPRDRMREECKATANLVDLYDNGNRVAQQKGMEIKYAQDRKNQQELETKNFNSCQELKAQGGSSIQCNALEAKLVEDAKARANADVNRAAPVQALNHDEAVAAAVANLEKAKAAAAAGTPNAGGLTNGSTENAGGLKEPAAAAAPVTAPAPQQSISTVAPAPRNHLI